MAAGGAGEAKEFTISVDSGSCSGCRQIEVNAANDGILNPAARLQIRTEGCPISSRGEVVVDDQIHCRRLLAKTELKSICAPSVMAGRSEISPSHVLCRYRPLGRTTLWEAKPKRDLYSNYALVFPPGFTLSEGLDCPVNRSHFRELQPNKRQVHGAKPQPYPYWSIRLCSIAGLRSFR